MNKNEMSRPISRFTLEVQGRSTTCPFNAVSESMHIYSGGNIKYYKRSEKENNKNHQSAETTEME